MVMSRMKNRLPDFELTSREISILCAFLDITVLYGIQTDFFADWSVNPKDKIMRTCKKMKQKNLFTYDITGKVIIPSKLYDCLKLIGEPKCMYRIRSIDHKGKKKEIFLYGKDQQYVYLEPSKTRNNKVYIFHDKSEVDFILQPLTIQMNQEENRTIIMPLHILQKSRKKAHNFELIEAEKILKNQLKEGNEKLIKMFMESFQGKMPITFWDFWEWEKGRQTICESRCFVHWENLKFELSINDGENLVLRG